MKYLLPKTALIVHNAITDAVPYPDAPVTDNDTVSTAKEISEILKNEGIKTKLFPVGNLNDLKNLQKAKTDFIFNCADDNIGDIPFSSHFIPETAEKMGITYSGGSSKNILLTTDKTATKEILLKNGISTPLFVVIEDQKRPSLSGEGLAFTDLTGFPLIVKPIASDGSEGITQKSVVKNQSQLIKAINNNFKLFHQPALVEKYIIGREINVAILEIKGPPEVLPASEITFPKEYGQKYKIVDFESKWRPETPQFNHTPAVCPAKISPSLSQILQTAVIKIWEIMDLQGYARVDFRIDKNGNPFVLEINVNPDIENNPFTGFPRAARAFGLDYKNLILTIVDSAMHRAK
ncbi:ATP-grasp domain-containing protein [Candidatus Collierbacteria bacterium]|nr:ATP-grasp domain-containing protein [Candidatus Collierbacteria bacterium]